MKILQTFLACLIFLIAQVALSYAVDIKGEVIPLPGDEGIHYTLADDAEVRVRIYDLQGALIRQLDIGRQGAGRYLTRQTAAYWDGRDQSGASVTSGVYFYTLKADAFSKTGRIVIRK